MIRAFVSFVSVSIIACWLGGCTSSNKQLERVSLKDLVMRFDSSVTTSLKSQVLDSTSEFYGAIPDPYLIHHPSSCAGFIQQLTCAYVHPESAYYRDLGLLKRMTLAMRYLLAKQHADGTIDLLTTNFHSTPDLAFTIEPLAIAYNLMSRLKNHEDSTLLSMVKIFLLKGGQALTEGGIHTPNHRWVVCMALSRVHALFPDPKFLERIDQWLKEGIDQDMDGQYQERSTAVYTPITNKSFITISRLVHKPTLLPVVLKNLELSQYLIHHNGDLVTEISRRQDQYLARPSEVYYYAYKWMAVHQQDTFCHRMAGMLEQLYGHRIKLSIWPYILEDSILAQEIPVQHALATYEKLFPSLGLARIKKNKTDVSILSDNSTFLTLHHGDAVLQAIKVASAFFGKGQFKSDTILHTADGYILQQRIEGPYYQPMPDSLINGSGQWEDLPKEKRAVSEVQKLESTIILSMVDNKWIIDFNIHGTDGVPVSVELSFKSGGSISGIKTLDRTNGIHLASDKKVRYTYGQNKIVISPGVASHHWTQLRGADPKLTGESVYLTGYTPFKHRMEIEGE